MRTLLAAMAMLVSLQLVPVPDSAVRDVSAAALQEQQPQPAQPAQPGPDARVDIEIRRDGGGPWYANPMWIAIGVVGAVVLILLVVLASRGSGTTVVRS